MGQRPVVLVLGLMVVCLVGWWLSPNGDGATDARSELFDSLDRNTGDDEGEARRPPRTTDELIADLVDFVENERGLVFIEDVDMKFLDDAAFTALLNEEFNSRTADELAELAQTEVVWHALGLIDRDVDLIALFDSLLNDAVLGFYDAETDELVVRGQELTPYVQSVLVHELVHALEDQHFNLLRPELEKLHDESAVAFASLVEGSAAAVETAFIDSLTDSQRRDLFVEEALVAGDINLEDIPESVLLSVAFPYVFGEFFVDALVFEGSLDAAFAEPPVTTEQILDPFTYTLGEGAIEIASPVADGPVVDEGSLGALGLLLLAPDDFAMFEAMEGWGGDRYVAWNDGDRRCVRLAAVGDTQRDTDEIRDALERWAATHPNAMVGVAPDSGQVVVTACSGTGDDDPALIGAVCLTEHPDFGSLDPSLCLLDLDTGERTVLATVITPAERISLSSDRKRIAYADDQQRLAVVVADGSSEPRIVADGPVAAPRWMTDEVVGFVGASRRQIVETSVETDGQRTTLVDLDDVDLVGPDEEIVTFDSRADILVIVTSIGDAADTTESLLVRIGDVWSRPIPHGPHAAWAPDIHPTKDLVALAIDAVITVIDLEGNVVDSISPSEWVGTSPSWAPSGTQLVWSADGVGGALPGPAVLFRTDWPTRTDPTPIVGNSDEPFDNFPVFPDW